MVEILKCVVQLIKNIMKKNFFDKSFDEENPMKIIREIDRCYEETVLLMKE